MKDTKPPSSAKFGPNFFGKSPPRPINIILKSIGVHMAKDRGAIIL